ncbi:MAG TPA: lipoyl synthase [Acidobacteriota bacterium]|nr:lipoyl synthase [Acidobacteriota bacterium]
MESSEKEVKINKPSWLKVKLPTHKNFFKVSGLLRQKGIHTICQSAKCPNIYECWSKKTATFLIMGDVCTRNCSFCAVKSGKPKELSPDEPERIAEAVECMELKYAVITSVTRDDLRDGGASFFAETVKTVKDNSPGIKVEVLIPDFKGSTDALKTVIQSRPSVINHNLEVPHDLYSSIKRVPQNYLRSLQVLEEAKKMGAFTKSGIMVGLGENYSQIIQTFKDLRNVSCDLLTVGQYLQAISSNSPVKKYYTPDEFKDLKNKALNMGFKQVESGPLVRSSYRAHNLYNSLFREH